MACAQSLPLSLPPSFSLPPSLSLSLPLSPSLSLPLSPPLSLPLPLSAPGAAQRPPPTRCRRGPAPACGACRSARPRSDAAPRLRGGAGFDLGGWVGGWSSRRGAGVPGRFRPSNKAKQTAASQPPLPPHRARRGASTRQAMACPSPQSPPPQKSTCVWVHLNDDVRSNGLGVPHPVVWPKGVVPPHRAAAVERPEGAVGAEGHRRDAAQHALAGCGGGFQSRF